MPLSNNQLRVQVDTPAWEWCRFAPAVSSGISCTCTPDNSNFNTVSGRYIYYMIAATGFWRYDTWTDTYQQQSSPLNAPLTASSMRFAGSQGYFGRVISATANTIQTGLTFGGSAKGFKIRIISGKGAGQERIITSVADPVVYDYGAATAGSTTTLTDTNKTWTSGYVGTTLNVNNWVGYTVRVILGTGLLQMRRILYNSSTVLTIGNVSNHAEDPWCHTTWTAPAAGTLYQIESSVITVDTAWDTQPDDTSRYVIQSGGIWLLSGATATPFFTMQYYDILADVWYVKPTLTNMINAAPTDLCLERKTENASLWDLGIATGVHSTTTLQDTTQSWTTNQWAGYSIFFYSGTGRNQIIKISSNTSNILTFSSALSTAPDNTTRYQIVGFDAGTLTSSVGKVLTDTSKSWTTNQWANFGVRILSGTGAGQLRTISSNTATTITTYVGWNIQPDSTSIYSIQGDTNNLYFTWGGAAEIFLYRNGDLDQLTNGRALDLGVACTMCAYLSDSNHTIYEQPQISISTITRSTTTATVTTVNSHNLKVGQYVSIHGATGANARYYDGLFQVTTVPSTTTFTYTMSATPSASAVGVGTQTTSIVYDGGKDYSQYVSSGNSGESTITFSSKTPSNINGWYVTGTNIGTTGSEYCKVVSGAGTTTLTLSVANAGAVSGLITFNAWAPSATGTASSGNSGELTIVMSAATPTYINGWYVTGTGIGIGAVVTSGAGTTTLVLSVVNTAAISSSTVTFSSPWGNCMIYGNSGTPTITTGVSVGQQMQVVSNTGNSLTTIVAMAAAMTAGVTRYIVSKRDCIGAAFEGASVDYNSGVATGGSTTTLIDANAFWTQATGCSGSAQSTTITLGAACPANVTGWYVSGTNVAAGAQVVSGAGTTTITVSVANSGAVGVSITLCAWNTNALVGKRIKFLSGATGGTQELTITASTSTTGTITFATATAPINSTTSYSIISAPIKGLGSTLQWAYGLSDVTKRGKYMFSARGGGVAGIDRLDMTTDRWALMHYSPVIETLTTGSMYAYDGNDRLYFTKDATMRVYYLDLITNWVHGAGYWPYSSGTAIIGNRMEVYETVDGLKYLWVNRHTAAECFKQLLFY